MAQGFLDAGQTTDNFWVVTGKLCINGINKAQTARGLYAVSKGPATDMARVRDRAIEVMRRIVVRAC
jgi:uncharacterized membrane protein